MCSRKISSITNGNYFCTLLYISEVHLPSIMTAINDPSEPVRLTEEYFRCIDRVKSDLTNVIISVSDVVKQASQKRFNDTLAEIWNDQHRLPEHERLSTDMLRLIDPRQTNIAKCLQCIFEFKSQLSIHVPSTSTAAP